MKTRQQVLLIAIVAIIVGVLAFMMGYFFPQSGNTSSAKTTAQAKKPLYWVAPMDPNYRKDKPGKSPMGMDLVPVYEQANDEGTIQISPSVENNIAVKTQTVGKEYISQNINTVGYIKVSDQANHAVNTKVDGWVHDLNISRADKVKAGQLLLKLYSPKVILAEQEYLLALKYNNPDLIKAGIEKLQTLGMNTKEINAVKTSKKPIKYIGIYAEHAGYITQLHIKNGQKVLPSQSLMRIANLDTVWMVGQVNEAQASAIKVGDMANVELTAIAGKAWQGKVEKVYPNVNANNRTVDVRIVIKNTGEQLKPNMSGNFQVKDSQSKAVLAIPSNALINDGIGKRVILSLGDGKFKPVSVSTGQSNHEWIQITKGLKAGDKIVTSAHFLIDSESNTRSAFSKMEAPNKETQEAHSMHDMHKMHDMKNHDMHMNHHQHQ